MMALGSSYGGVGSSGPSNLSASAPPFTVDKSVYRPKSDPFLGYSETPYVYPLNPSAGIQATVFNPNIDPGFTDGKLVSTTSGQSADIYGVPDHRFVDSRSSYFVPRNPGTFQLNTYDQYQSGATTTTIGKDSYYSHNISSVEDSVSEGSNEYNYDLLSDSVTVNTQVGGLPQVAPLEYSYSWTGFWNGVNGKQAISSSLYSKDYELSDLSAFKSYNKQGVETLYPKSNSGKDYVFEGSSSSPLPSTAISQESPLIEDSFQGLTWNPWATNPYSATADKPATSGHLAFGASVKSPLVVVRSPSSGKISLDQNDVASKKSNFGENKDVGRDKFCAEYDLFSVEPPPLCFDLKNQFSANGVKSQVYNFSSGGTKLDDKDATDRTLIDKSVLLPSLKEHDFLELNCEKADGLCSGDKSSDSTDSHTAVVDSPCWKGAPSSRFSPFGNPDLLGQEFLSKDVESSNKLDYQGFFNKALNTIDVVHIGLKVNESSSGEASLVTENVLLEQGDCGPEKQKQASSGTKAETAVVHGDQFVADNGNSGKKIHDNLESNGDSKVSFITSEEIVKEGDVASEGKLEPSVVGTPGKSQEQARATSTGRVKKKAFSSHSEWATELVGDCVGWYANLDSATSELVNTMRKLSEMLSSRCSNNPAAITVLDCSNLRDIVININSCLGPERVVQSTPSGEVVHRETLAHGGNPHGLLSTSSDTVQSTKVSAADAGHGNDSSKDEAIPALYSGSNDPVDPVSVKSTTEAAGDVNMTQAIKRVLCENLPAEEEMNVQALFYKNLWLEAEAALCCSAVNSRFRRMKKEMDNHMRSVKVEETKEVPSGEIPPDVHGVGELRSKSKDVDPKRSTAVQSVKVDASVMERVQILSSCGEKLDATEVDVQDSTAGVECEVSGVQEITKCLAGSSGLVNSGGQKPPSPVKGDKDFKDPPKAFPGISQTDILEGDGDAEASVMARFNILKRRIDRSDSGEKDPRHSVFGQEHGHANLRNILEDRIQVQLSQFGAYENLPQRNNVQEVIVQEPTILHAESCEADETKEPHLFHFLPNSRSKNLEVVKNVYQGFVAPSTWGQGLVSQTRAFFDPRPVNVNSVGVVRHNLGNGLLEGWYDCPASEWEHVSKEDFQW
ncbi:hypothetical protein Drorol1_Dr00009396 [Drosera rotundifolia]